MLFARLTALFGLLFFVVTGAILVSKANDNFFPGGLIVLGFIAVPYVLLALAARFARYACVKIGSFVVLLITGTFCTAGFADYAFSIWTKPSHDAQAALIFVALPMFQMMVSGVSVGLLFALGARLEHRKEKGADRSAPSVEQ